MISGRMSLIVMRELQNGSGLAEEQARENARAGPGKDPHGQAESGNQGKREHGS